MRYILDVPRNLALKVACVESGKRQNEIAKLAKIHPTRLSALIRNDVSATEGERLRLAGVLQRPVSDLFPEVAA